MTQLLGHITGYIWMLVFSPAAMDGYRDDGQVSWVCPHIYSSLQAFLEIIGNITERETIESLNSQFKPSCHGLGIVENSTSIAKFPGAVHRKL